MTLHKDENLYRSQSQPFDALNDPFDGPILPTRHINPSFR